jgi:hypothetical protein
MNYGKFHGESLTRSNPGFDFYKKNLSPLSGAFGVYLREVKYSSKAPAVIIGGQTGAPARMFL